MLVKFQVLVCEYLKAVRYRKYSQSAETAGKF